jgi:TRAP-type mannitol/chloroaromatic compound transport system permease large subunit
MTFVSQIPAGQVMATTIWGGSASWTLAALPLFIWMGEILFRTRLSRRCSAAWRRGSAGCPDG